MPNRTCKGGVFIKNKYNDNRLAEEFDLIVLTKQNDAHYGLKIGQIGTLIYAYEGKDRPLYAEFACADGTKREEPLGLHDFRVLNERDPRDLSVIVQYMRAHARKNA